MRQSALDGFFDGDESKLGVLADESDRKAKKHIRLQNRLRLLAQDKAEQLAALDYGYGLGMAELMDESVSIKNGKVVETLLVRSGAKSPAAMRKLPQSVQVGIRAHAAWVEWNRRWSEEGLRIKLAYKKTPNDRGQCPSEDQAHDYWRVWRYGPGEELRAQMYQQWHAEWGHIPGWWNPVVVEDTPDEEETADEYLIGDEAS